jgi:hypothetical protein
MTIAISLSSYLARASLNCSRAIVFGERCTCHGTIAWLRTRPIVAELRSALRLFLARPSGWVKGRRAKEGSGFSTNRSALPQERMRASTKGK